MKAIPNKNGIQPGDAVKASSLYEEDVASYDARVFIVTAHIAEDRGPGETVVMFLTGETKRFVWDFENPDVVYLGKGDFRASF